MEEKSIFWNDDFELVLSIVYKTLWHLQEKMREEDDILEGKCFNSEIAHDMISLSISEIRSNSQL